ncbi:MAG: septum formation protein Maf [Eubacterium sp.]|jgi:septum formation protein|nr:septum formation protein Maf [Eubacterium sp.]
MINLDKTKIILASQSPRRSELMRQAGYEFEIIASTIEEKITQTKPNLVVEELSLQKADNVLDMILQSIDLSLMAFDDLSLMIIGADTVVSKNGNIMGKPKGKENAYEMIDSIQGQTHQVYTGITIIVYDFNTGEKTYKTFSESTNVTLYPMTPSEITHYISTSDCYDKAGGYGIQGEFAVYVKEINGDYNNVVGLPIARLYQEMKNCM